MWLAVGTVRGVVDVELEREEGEVPGVGGTGEGLSTSCWQPCRPTEIERVTMLGL